MSILTICISGKQLLVGLINRLLELWRDRVWLVFLVQGSQRTFTRAGILRVRAAKLPPPATNLSLYCVLREQLAKLCSMSDEMDLDGSNTKRAVRQQLQAAQAR